jgi:hypothetical protein
MFSQLVPHCSNVLWPDLVVKIRQGGLALLEFG